MTPYGALNPRLLHRHALSVDETAHTYRLSHESLQGTGSQCSMALDLHLECPVTLRIRDKRRNPLKRQGKIEAEDEKHLHEQVVRSNSHSPRMSYHRTKSNASGSPGLSPSSTFCNQRRNSNASDCTHRARTKRRECHHHRGRLERAISSDSRLTGVQHRCHHHHYHHPHPQISVEEAVPGAYSSDTDITHARVKFPKQANDINY